MSLTSMPRAATSVATRMSIPPALYCSMILFRPTGAYPRAGRRVFSPWACSCSATMPVVYLVLQKTMARYYPQIASISRMMISIFFTPDALMLYLVDLRFKAVLYRQHSDSGRAGVASQPMSMTSREMVVAENIHLGLSPFAVQNLGGHPCKKPMSSILSAPRRGPPCSNCLKRPNEACIKPADVRVATQESVRLFLAAASCLSPSTARRRPPPQAAAAKLGQLAPGRHKSAGRSR